MSSPLVSSLSLQSTPTNDPTADIATRIQNVTKDLGDRMEGFATHQVVSVLDSFDIKHNLPSDNLSKPQRIGLNSLKRKCSDLRFIPADKGNATVIVTR